MTDIANTYFPETNFTIAGCIKLGEIFFVWIENIGSVLNVD